MKELWSYQENLLKLEHFEFMILTHSLESTKSELLDKIRDTEDKAKHCTNLENYKVKMELIELYHKEIFEIDEILIKLRS